MGPYVAVEYKTDELMVLRRNPYYWKVDEAGKQLPYHDEVVFEKGTSGVGRTLGTMAGSIDHSNLENPGTFIETMKRQAEPDAHFYVEWGPETLGYYLQLNQSATLGVEDDRDAAAARAVPQRAVPPRRQPGHRPRRHSPGCGSRPLPAPLARRPLPRQPLL